MATKNNSFQYEMTADPKNGAAPSTLSGLISNFKYNFLTRQIEVVPGLTYNQYDIIKREYFYIHNQFESGPTDENGDPKYFYDLHTDRNDQATKNIDLDTKDCYIKSEGGAGAQLESWLLRREFMAYAKTSGFGMKLNEMAQDLPTFGTVVWKKCKDENGKTTTENVDLINIINDPSVKNLKDGLMIERHILTSEDVKGYKSWDKTQVESMLRTVRPVNNIGFMSTNGQASLSSVNTVDDTTPYFEIYEMWGMVPRWLAEHYAIGGKQRRGSGLPDVSPAGKTGNASEASGSNTANDFVYVMAVVAGIESGQTEHVLFCKQVDKGLFPYKEVHYRRRKGRWMGVGNVELLFALTEKANEITNRYFSSLRITLLHLFQTRDKLHVKNILTDLLDGDMTVSKSEITTIPTEFRGAGEYRSEMMAIEGKADRMCSSLEIVTGANLPANTPFRLGAQQLASATKFFGFVQQNMGLFLEQVFNEWLLVDFSKGLTDEHVLDILDDTDDMEIYYNAKRKLYQYEVMKRFVLSEGRMPDPAQLKIVGALVQDQIAKAPKQILVESKYYANLTYSIKMVITGENDTKKENLTTLSDVFQVLAANPAGLQDARLMKILNLILEETGFSPLQINSIAQTEPNLSLNPANQGGASATRTAAPAGGGTAVPSPVANVGAVAAAPAMGA